MHKIFLFYNKFISCPLHVSSTCARHQEVKIALHSLFQRVRGTATYMYDDTRGCVMQFWPPDDEHMYSKHAEAWNKLMWNKEKCCASSWLITEIKVRSGAPCFGVVIATMLILLTTSTYNLHPAVILENITVAQPAKKLPQLIEPKGTDLLPCSRPLVLGSRLWL